jgi:cytochrome c551/c552
MKVIPISGIVVLAVLASYIGIGRTQTAPQEQALINQYCVACHSERLKTGGLVLEKLDPAHAADSSETSETWEKVIRKVRAGMMPPAGAPRPNRPTLDAFAASLEAQLDRAAAAHPNPGATALHRLNRNEYGNAIRDLLALDVDVSTLLPADDSAEGFDNVADVLRVSPSLMDRYVAAGAKISRLAVGDASIGATTSTYRTSSASEDLPLGAPGGLAVRHYFPLDGVYSFKARGGGGIPYDNRVSKIEVTVDGESVRLVEVGYYVTADFKLTLKAGTHSLGFSLLEKDPQEINHTWRVVPGNVGVTNVAIAGPLSSTGPGDTPSRRSIFVCQPAPAASEKGAGADEVPCAKKILSTLARRAYRGPVTDGELETLLGFYQRGRNTGTFDSGIQLALQRMLVSPRFVFRFEEEPDGVSAGSAYRISNLELASRLSFFLWGSIPDDQLLDLAVSNKLRDPAVLREQTLRMLRDPRSDALVKNFAGQWLFLREVKSAPGPANAELKQALQRETELLFQSILGEDRSVLDLLNADYTFVNERLARHYGIPNIYGNHFRRVTVQDPARRGLLGQGSLLLVTSVADRTSPVARGKWILENLLGVAAPVPPPNVPALEESASKNEPRSVRQQMEIHRRNAVCATCHKIMDPIGLSLENFDLVGKWRDDDQGIPIDASAELVDGTKINGPASLRNALLDRSDVFLTTMTEKLMTYGLGRGVRYFDLPAVRTIVRDAAKNDNRFSAFVVGVVESTPFQMRVKRSAGEE